jgi:DNA-binding NtrC family response regulator
MSTFFLREVSERLGKQDIELSSETWTCPRKYCWPGNVRQLRNAIQRAVALSMCPALLSRPLSCLRWPYHLKLRRLGLESRSAAVGGGYALTGY